MDGLENPFPEGFRTQLAQTGRQHTKAPRFVNPPVYRGSTVLYPDMAQRRAGMSRRLEQALVYGTMGSETHFALEDAVAEIEGGSRCQIVSTGLAAITTALLAYLKAGDHCLVPDSCYEPTRSFCDKLLTRLGVSTTYYPPASDEAGVGDLFRPNTTVLFTESPGSHTFEMQDLPALARAAHARGAKVLMDNTWGLGFFQPFRHGVDVSIQALTKYAGGHSDLLLGAIITDNEGDWDRVRTASLLIGQYASPDDCWLALRGLRTLAVRLERHMRSGLEVARWLAGRPEVHQVLHPALPGAPGHEIWKRDFSGACGLFGVVFKPDYSVEATHAFVEALQLFGIGASWGGYESLALPTTGFVSRKVKGVLSQGPMVRLHIGLEDTADLIADLGRGLSALRNHRD